MTLAYDGTHYHGWQVQPDMITIQGRIESALKTITAQEVTLVGAGRTDAGVHALHQVAAFSTDTHLEPNTIKRALNATLPVDIRIISADYVSEDFNPRFSAKAKRYAYVISLGDLINPFFYRYTWHLKQPLDVVQIKAASAMLIGRVDFKSFCATDTDVKTTVREVFDLRVQRLTSLEFIGFSISGNFIKVSIEADGFLRHMVRNIVGTLVDVGKGRISSQEMVGIVAAKDRRRAGQNAPAKGLFLEQIYY